MKTAYIFRGAPGSGKGTISKEFISKLPGKVTYLELDNFRWGFHFNNRKISDITDEEHLLAYQNFLSMLENYCKNGKYDLVIEGLFAWDKNSPHGNMQDIIKLLEEYDFNYFVFLLFADKEIIWKRNTSREYSVPRKEFDKLYENVMDETGEQEIKIDVGKLTVDQTLKKIIKWIK